MALKGLKVIELAGLAPGPFLGLILSDFGAKVIRVDNISGNSGNMFSQPKDTAYLNLKHPKGQDILARLSSTSDVLIEPFRPGVMERLNLGPDRLCTENNRLIYARISGYGQTGPMAAKASHDINFLSLSGVLSRLGHSDRPPIAPLNLLGDFAGGSFLCAFAIMTALYERERSGKGQIIDHSMTEGAAYLASFFWESLKTKEVLWPNWPRRGENLIDFGSPFYRCYECADGKFIAVGSLEEKFYQAFIETLGIDEERFNRYDWAAWPEMAQEIEKIIRTKTRDEWAKAFENVDACVTPVLDMDEVVTHCAQNRIRQSFDPESGYPHPAPKLSRTPPIGNRKNFLKNHGHVESQTRSILREFGYSEKEIDEFGPDVIE